MQTRTRIPIARPSLGRRTVTLAASAAVTIAVGVGAAFVASLIASAADSGPATTTDAAVPCDTDGVTVGYDVRYAASLGGYAVSAVRVLGIDSACSGGAITVALGGPSGDPLAGATLTGTVGGDTIRMPLVDTVSAAAVSRVYVTLAGQTTIAAPPATPEAPATTTTTPTLAVVPSLCPNVSGALAVVGQPQECGSVAAAPTITAATLKPTPVASWPAQLFADKVKVTLETPPESELKAVSIAAGATYVRLSIVRESTGEPITSWSGVMAIDFPAQDGPFLSAYSEDGVSWHTIPQLDGPQLPDGQPDGYFVHNDRTVTVYTRHATFFALAPPPAKVAKVHAKLLPTGAVRLTWTPSVAGLGVASYWVVRNNTVIRKVDGTKTIALLRRLQPSRLALRVIAVDPIGTRSDTSGAARVQVPLLVGAQLQAVQPVVRAHVRLTASAQLRVLVLAADGRRLTILPGTTIRLRPAESGVPAPPGVAGTSIAAQTVREPTADLSVGLQAAGDYTLALRVPSAQLARTGRYRVVVLAQPKHGAGDRAEIRFRR